MILLIYEMKLVKINYLFNQIKIQMFFNLYFYWKLFKNENKKFE